MSRNGRSVAVMLAVLVATTVGAVSGRSSSAEAQTVLPSPAPPAEREWYTPLVPARLLDTRPGASTVDGLGLPSTPLGPGASGSVDVLGRGGVPATGVAAVVLNVTVTAPTARTFLTVWPSGQPLPTASNLNVVGGQTVANLVIAKVGAGGRVAVFNESGEVHVIVDVAGYVPATDSYVPLVPARLLDTRPGATTVDGRGLPAAKIGPAGTIDVEVLGRGGVPASGVDAVALNVTAHVDSASHLTVWPTGIPLPVASNLNPSANQTVPNSVVARIGAGGRVSVYNQSGRADVIVDVAGYFLSGGTYVALPPARIFETRPGAAVLPGAVNRQAQIGVGQTIEVKVTGLGGVPEDGVSAVVLNVTAVLPDSPSYLTVWPTGSPRPNASNLNLACCGRVVPNLVVAKVGAGGRINVYNENGNTDLLVDVAGYFVVETGAVRGLDLAGESSCALLEAGTLTCWGSTARDPSIQYGGSPIQPKPYPYELNTVTDAVAVAVGTSHACVLRPNGEVWCWTAPTVFALAGIDAFQQVWPAARIALPLRAVEIDATYTHSCALLENGTVWCWGRDYAGTTRPMPFAVGNLDQVESLSMSSHHACAVRANGGVRCWGVSNGAPPSLQPIGTLGDGSGVDSPTSAVDVVGVTDAVSVSTGGLRSCAVLGSGGVSCWGANQGPLASPLMDTDFQPVSGAVDVVLGDELGCVLLADSTVSCASTRGGRISTESVTGLPPVESISAGRWHLCAVATDSDVYCWGNNQYGQIGDGTVFDRPTPVVVLEYL